MIAVTSLNSPRGSRYYVIPYTDTIWDLDRKEYTFTSIIFIIIFWTSDGCILSYVWLV